MDTNKLNVLIAAYFAGNDTITSLEFKNYVHSSGAVNHFDKKQFTQAMASDALTKYFSENKDKVQRKHNGSYYVYSKKLVKNEDQQKLNPTIVCYNRLNPREFIAGTNRNIIRKECKNKFDMVDRDLINTCSAVYFDKHYFKVL